VNFLSLTRRAEVIRSRWPSGRIIAANRAWLSPTDFDFIKPISDPEGPTFIGHYQNIGRFPALDVKNAMGWVAIPLDLVGQDRQRMVQTRRIHPNLPSPIPSRTSVIFSAAGSMRSTNIAASWRPPLHTIGFLHSVISLNSYELRGILVVV
jgi:hypothetical protein